VVIDEEHLEEKLKVYGSKVIEKDHPDKLKSFRTSVLTKLVKFWRDAKDIKLSVLETLSEFSNRADLIGWIPGNEAINSGAIAEEIARLTKENATLQTQLKNLSSSSTRYNGLTFEELYEFLNSYKLNISENMMQNSEHILRAITGIVKALGEEQASLLHYFWALSRKFDYKKIESRHNSKEDDKLYEFGLLQEIVEEHYSRGYTGQTYKERLYTLSDAGKQFLLRLRQDARFKAAGLEEYILQ
jgi:hypothetical protein